MASLGVSTLYVKTFIYWNASNITKSGHEPKLLDKQQLFMLSTHDRLLDAFRGSADAIVGWLGALEQRTGLREIIPQLVHRICRISKGSELSAHHGLRQAEGVATEQIDMAPPQRS